MSLKTHEDRVNSLTNKVNTLDPGNPFETIQSSSVAHVPETRAVSKFRIWYLFAAVPLFALSLLVFKPKFVCHNPKRRDKNGKPIWKIHKTVYWASVVALAVLIGAGIYGWKKVDSSAFISRLGL